MERLLCLAGEADDAVPFLFGGPTFRARWPGFWEQIARLVLSELSRPSQGRRKRQPVIDEAEAAVVRRIFDLYLGGYEGPRAVVPGEVDGTAGPWGMWGGDDPDGGQGRPLALLQVQPPRE